MAFVAVADDFEVGLINADSLAAARSARMPISRGERIADIKWAPRGAYLIVGVSGPLQSSVLTLDPSTLVVLKSVTIPGFTLNRVHLINELDDAALVSGALGWMRVDLVSGSVSDRVSFERDTLLWAVLSPDNSMIYGQRTNTADEDAAFAYRVSDGALMGSFAVGDAGGEMVFIPREGGDQVILMVGDGARDQDAFVLDARNLHLIQAIGAPGLGQGVVATDGHSALVTQNRDLPTFTQSGGATVHRIFEDDRGFWSIAESVELMTGEGVYPAGIVSSPERGRYYVTVRHAPYLFVVEES